MGTRTVYEAAGGSAGLERLAEAWHRRVLADAGLTAEPLRQVLHDYFAWATTHAMSRYHHSADDVPAGLTLPRWSWDGLQD
jgi:hemoglobin